MIQDTLAGELSSTRRVRVHARVAEALEELYGDSAESHAAELAHHFAEAEPAIGGEKLVHYSRLAGEQTLASRAYEDALGHFERGLAAKEGQPLDDETAGLLVGLGRAQAATAERHQFGDAVNNLRHALAFCRKAGYRPELALTCCDYADALLKRNDHGDRAKAITLLDESLAISSELGMRPLMVRAAAGLDQDQAEPGRAPAYPDGLTKREVEVLRLLAAGKTDRQIGEELFISARTVGYHVGNIVNKTTSTNRTEAAASASR